MKLGEMLVNSGLLTDEQLVKAVVDHKRSKMKLGQYLVREGVVSGAQIKDVISKQMKLKKYLPNEYPIDIDLAEIIPVEMAQKYQMVPLAKSKFLLTVAMTDPMDINALDIIEVYANTEIEAVICTDQELNQLIGSIYGSYVGIGGVLEEMEYQI